MKFIKSFSSITEGYDTEERKDMASKGLALPDGSFPIKDLSDLKKAIQAYGRAKDQAKAAKFIAKRAKALNATDLIPDTEDFQASLNEAENLPAEINEMAYGQLERIMDYAKMIRERMDAGQPLDSWMFSKVTVAYQNLNTIHDTLDTDDGIVESLKNSLNYLSKEKISRYPDPEDLAKAIHKYYKEITGEEYEDETQMSMDDSIADIIGHFKLDGPDFMSAWDKVIK